MACLYATGITAGTTATRFSPESNTNRAQIASLLVRMWRLSGKECPAGAENRFSDVADDSVHRDDIACLRALGVTAGATPDTFSPERLVTRAQMATFATRIRELIDPAAAP